MRNPSSILPPAANATTRRQALKGLGLGALGLASLNLLTSRTEAANPGVLGRSDINILNFALNLEYLKATYFTFGTTGSDITAEGVSISGLGRPGSVLIKSGAQVPFADSNIQQYTSEMAADDRAHVEYLRSVLGFFAVTRPTLDLELNFNTLARDAGIITTGETFDPFADDISFLLGAFYIVDVAVTFYRGVLPLVIDRTILSALAGFLGDEASHAGVIRAKLFEVGTTAQTEAQDLSALRDRLDGVGSLDQGVVLNGNANIAPVNSFGMTFSRTMRQVLNILFLKVNANSGGFFPNGFNG